MSANPSFLDSKKYSGQVEKVFLDLWEQYLLKQSNLSTINYLLPPDWQSEEEELTQERTNPIQKIANQESSQLITLLVDITGINEEDADFFFSSITMNVIGSSKNALYLIRRRCVT